MGFLDNLSSFVKFDFSGIKYIKANLFAGNKNSPFINIGKIEDHSTTVNVELNVTSKELDDPKTRSKALELVKEATLANRIQPILKDSSRVVVDDIKSVDKKSDTLEYFKDKIPKEDVPILRDAIFIRRLHEKGQSVDSYIRDLRQRYGDKGGNISNLCTAGYFETDIKTTYEELSKRPNFTPAMFIDNYRVIINGYPFAVL